MFRQALSKMLLPNLERDLSKSMSRELESAHAMADCFLASSSVYAYVPSRAFARTMTPQQGPIQYIKVDYSHKVSAGGLFQ
jgi:hypothetical protein